VAAAVVLSGAEVFEIADSKAVGSALRQSMLRNLLRRASALSVVSVPAWWIDDYGVGAANREALRGAIELLDGHAGCGLADGNLSLGPEIECLPRADGRSAAVAAASVAAKVLRDGAMEALAAEHAGYGFERNRGYGTREHRLALARLGPCRAHRLSYAGVGPG
jgi:ribonuclease HII